MPKTITSAEQFTIPEPARAQLEAFIRTHPKSSMLAIGRLLRSSSKQNKDKELTESVDALRQGNATLFINGLEADMSRKK